MARHRAAAHRRASGPAPGHVGRLSSPGEELGTPTAEEVAEVARWTHERLQEVLERHGRSLDGFDDAPDELAQEQPALASCYAASVGDQQLLGEAPGQRTRKLVDPVARVTAPGEALVDVRGINIHAGVAIPGRDRQRLERLVRYVARPPICRERLEVTPTGSLNYRFKRSWRDGTFAVQLEPLDFIARLAALIPPPNFHMVRYHGVLAAHAKARSEVVPGPVPEPVEPTQLRLVFDGEPTLPEHTATRSSRHPWAWLLQRVFAVDVMVCSRPRCGGAMRLVKIATGADAIAGVLARVGLGPRPPPRPRPALPGQLELDLSA